METKMSEETRSQLDSLWKAFERLYKLLSLNALVDEYVEGHTELRYGDVADKLDKIHQSLQMSSFDATKRWVLLEFHPSLSGIYTEVKHKKLTKNACRDLIWQVVESWKLASLFPHVDIKPEQIDSLAIDFIELRRIGGGPVGVACRKIGGFFNIAVRQVQTILKTRHEHTGGVFISDVGMEPHARSSTWDADDVLNLVEISQRLLNFSDKKAKELEKMLEQNFFKDIRI